MSSWKSSRDLKPPTLFVRVLSMRSVRITRLARLVSAVARIMWLLFPVFVLCVTFRMESRRFRRNGRLGGEYVLRRSYWPSLARYR
jgi:hypothetical protein